MQTEGSGLGLFMVRNIIKRHGGEITFESEEDMRPKVFDFAQENGLKILGLNTQRRNLE